MESAPKVPIWRRIRRHLWRWYICWFRKDYIEEWAKYKVGECRQCGRCCRIIVRCPMLIKWKGRYRCLIYSWGRPLQCIHFPIDPEDLKEVGYQCGYSFTRSMNDEDAPKAHRGKA